MIIRDRQRVARPRRLDHVVAARTQQAADERPNRILILDDQDRLGAEMPPRFDDGVFRLRVAAGCEWEVDREESSLAGTAVDLDPAVALRNDPVDGGEPQPGAFARGLRGEEGLENPTDCLGVHSYARVRDPQGRVSTRCDAV